MALRGAVAAGTATVLLLGGFGAFALWSDSQSAAVTQKITTGSLLLDQISGDVIWKLENPQVDGPGPVVIDPVAFRASPGDILSYTVNVTGEVKGSDLVAKLEVDPTQATLRPGISASDVDISVVGVDGEAIQILGTEAGTAIDELVTVRVEFTSAMTGGMNLTDAVDVSGMDLRLQQVATAVTTTP